MVLALQKTGGASLTGHCFTDEGTKAQRVQVTCTFPGLSPLNFLSSRLFSATFRDLSGRERQVRCGTLSYERGPSIWDLAMQARIQMVRVGNA